MEKFTVIKKIYVDLKSLQALNTDFDEFLKSDNYTSYNDKYDYCRGRVSSYHLFSQYFVTWKQNIFRHHNATLCIATSKSSYQTQEALDFISAEGGFSLSRDNLFMIPEVFPIEIFSLPSKEIIAPAISNNLEIHSDGYEILPMLVIGVNGVEKELGYDWWFANNPDKPQSADFAFFTFPPVAEMVDNIKSSK